MEWGPYDAAGTLKERTIRASGTGGAVVAVHSQAGGLIRLLPNRQGSVIDWLRPDGKLGGAYSFDAYGNSAQAGAAGPSFRYAGMRFDAETGLYHTPNRAYDPGDGRWMQLDPIGIKDGLNRYAYVKNSPLMGVDPTGLKCERTVNGLNCSFDKFYVEDKSTKTGLREVSRSELTDKQLKSIVRLEGNMTKSFINLSENPNRKSALQLSETPGKSVSVTSGQVAGLMERRFLQFVFKDQISKQKDKNGNWSTVNDAASTKDDTITFFKGSLSLTDKGQQRAHVHENFHGNGTHADAVFGAQRNPNFDNDHQMPWDRAADELLGF